MKDIFKTHEYYAWKHIRQRCYNPSNERYSDYGGRGITICEEWESFENFLADMGLCPKGYQLDRTDNNKGYSPENCRWTTSLINNRNQRKSKWWFIDGVRYESRTHAAKELGIPEATINSWCHGQGYGKYHYPPKAGCWTELKYQGGDK